MNARPLLLALTAMAVPGLAAAQHFTFKVPYTTRALPDDITKMRIACLVLDQAGSEVGGGEQDVSIPVGGDTGNRFVMIKFNAKPGKRPEQAVSYRCQMYEAWGKFFVQNEGSRLRVEGRIAR